MPNVTPGLYRNEYKLYNNKPSTAEADEDCKKCLEARIRLTGDEIGYNEHGNPIHFTQRNKRIL